MARHTCGTCAYCERPAIYNGSRADGPPTLLCLTHYARMRRGLRLDAPLRGVYADEWDRLMAACDAREAAETEAQLTAAEMRIRTAALAWAATKQSARAA